jgi:hypothetical protein
MAEKRDEVLADEAKERAATPPGIATAPTGAGGAA